MYMTARRTYTALILSVIALFVSACDKTCPGGPDSNVVEKTYRFEIVNQSGIDLTLSFESPAMPPEQTGFTTDGSRFEIAVAADETLSWVETVNIMMPEVMPISGFMWSCVRELRIDYSDGVSVDGQSLPEERRPTCGHTPLSAHRGRRAASTAQPDMSSRTMITATPPNIRRAAYIINCSETAGKSPKIAIFTPNCT